MGLDNGIVIKSNKRIKVPFWVRPTYRTPNMDGIELCYWRKCWGLGNDILNVLDDSEDDYSYSIDEVQVKRIMKKIQIYFRHHNWWNNSFWAWQEIRPRLIRDLINLHWLARYMKKNDVEVYFYDSY